MLAWDDDGNGLVLQVTTPSWPGSGSRENPRTDGNSLGCVADNNVLVAQHFFAVRLDTADVTAVASSLANASVVTNPDDPQIVRNGGPAEISKIVSGLGKKSTHDEILTYQMTAVPNVRIISKPARVHAPPWQLVSSVLGSVDLRVATWSKPGDVPDTAAGQEIDCWPAKKTDLDAPGAVVNSRTGHWDGKSLSLLGIGSPSGNHAKIGVSTSGSHPYAIFGDLNQQGALSGSCGAAQNGRGGNFYVVENQALHDAVSTLISNHQPVSLSTTPENEAGNPLRDETRRGRGSR